MADKQPREAEDLRGRISDALVAITQEWTGRSPSKADTTMVDDLVIVRIEDALSNAERKLAHSGQVDAVLDMRRRFQVAMRDPLVAAVEEILGRKVTVFMSDQHLDPDVALEMFVLAPPDEIEAFGDDSDPRD